MGNVKAGARKQQLLSSETSYRVREIVRCCYQMWKGRPRLGHPHHSGYISTPFLFSVSSLLLMIM